MKKTLLFIALAVILLHAGAQEPRTRVKRTTGVEQSTEADENQSHNYKLLLSPARLELFVKGDLATIEIMKSHNMEVGEVEWISADPKVARVSSKGVVTPIATGNTVIYAKDVAGVKSNECTVIISEPKQWGSISGKDKLNAQSEWIYFVNRADSNMLYKVMRNGQFLTRLNNDYPRCLNVTGNSIYYYNSNENTRPGLYRLSADNMKRSLLNDRDNIASLIVNHEGLAFYVVNDKAIFSQATQKSNATIDKLFDVNSVYSMVVNDEHLVYNHNWEDMQQPDGGGGLFTYNRETKKKEEYFSIYRNTSHLILDDQEKKVYVCIYAHPKEPLNFKYVPDIFENRESHPSGWFSLNISYDPQKEMMKELQRSQSQVNNQNQAFDILAEKYGRLKKLPLTENDMILFVHDAWVYYTRDSFLRRINTNMKLDQELFYCGNDAGITTDGKFIYYWTPENKLFRRVMDGRFEKEISVTPIAEP